MAVYDPSHLSHFVKSQPVNNPTVEDSQHRTKSDLASGLGLILKEHNSPIQAIFDDLNLSKTAHIPNWLKNYKGFPSEKYSNTRNRLPISSMEQEDQINRRFVTL